MSVKTLGTLGLAGAKAAGACGVALVYVGHPIASAVSLVACGAILAGVIAMCVNEMRKVPDDWET